LAIDQAVWIALCPLEDGRFYVHSLEQVEHADFAGIQYRHQVSQKDANAPSRVLSRKLSDRGQGIVSSTTSSAALKLMNVTALLSADKVFSSRFISVFINIQET
jgi:hypothetical protein